MKVRFQIEPWDEETRATFVDGMAAILAAYLSGNGEDQGRKRETSDSQRKQPNQQEENR